MKEQAAAYIRSGRGSRLEFEIDDAVELGRYMMGWWKLLVE